MRRPCRLIQWPARTSSTDVLGGDELVHVVVGNGPLLFEGRGIEPIVQEAFPFPGHPDHGAPPCAVMVGHHQPVGRDEGSGAPGDSQGRQTGPVEPVLIGAENRRSR